MSFLCRVIFLSLLCQHKTKTMDVPKDFLKIWKKELTPGDQKKIANENGISLRTVQRAKSEGKCLESTMDLINEFLKKKKIEEAEFVKSFETN